MRGALLTIAILVVANLAIIWALSILPGQDLPQHLSYATILRDYFRPDLPFQDYYLLPARPPPYATVHRLLAWLGSWTSISVALRILMSGYVVTVVFALHELVSACHAAELSHARAPAWSGLLACLVVWNPVTCMGFLPFTLSIPVFLVACASLFRWTEASRGSHDLALLAAGAALLLSIHVVAAGCLLLLATLHAAANPSYRRFAAALAVLVMLVLVAQLWRSVGELAEGLEFLSALFRVEWRDPLLKLSYVVWTVFGPFRWGGVLLVAVAAALAALLIHRSIGQRSAAAPRSIRRTLLLFGLLSWFAPFALYRPSEVTFLNFRMMTLSFALLLALIPPAMLSSKRSAIVLAGLCALVTGHFALRALSFAQEATPVLSLLERAQPGRRLLALPFHNRSAHFAKTFGLTHFLPLYYTVLHGGITSQLWGKATDHLSIDYRPDKRLARPPDWEPGRVVGEQFDGFDYVLMQSATAEDPNELRAQAARTRALISSRAALIECRQLWCLYQVGEAAAAQTFASGPR